MLKIALLGEADAQKTKLAFALTEALRAAGSPAVVRPFDNLTSATDLASQDLVLLMGLQSAGMTPPAHEIQAADRRIREALDQACIPYRVLYGADHERLHHARQACGGLLKQVSPPGELNPQGSPTAGMASDKKARQWTWMCDKCSDPVCEHRLLSDLLASRAAKC